MNPSKQVPAKSRNTKSNSRKPAKKPAKRHMLRAKLDRKPAPPVEKEISLLLAKEPTLADMHELVTEMMDGEEPTWEAAADELLGTRRLRALQAYLAAQIAERTERTNVPQPADLPRVKTASDLVALMSKPVSVEDMLGEIELAIATANSGSDPEFTATVYRLTAIADFIRKHGSSGPRNWRDLPEWREKPAHLVSIPCEFIEYAKRHACDPFELAGRVLLKFARTPRTHLTLKSRRKPVLGAN